MRCSILLAVSALALPLVSTQAQAQYYHSGARVHIEHPSYDFRDSHGRVIGGVQIQTGHPGNHHIVQAPIKVTFGGFGHVDELAARLEALTNELCLDLHYNYSHNYGFRETYREAYQVLEVARYCHAAEHHQDRAAMREQLSGLDALFHHVQDDVRGWTRHHHRQIGHLGIVTKMDMIEDTLHHLMEDVGVHGADFSEQAPLPSNASIAPAVGPIGVAPALPPLGVSPRSTRTQTSVDVSLPIPNSPFSNGAFPRLRLLGDILGAP